MKKEMNGHNVRIPVECLMSDVGFLISLGSKSLFMDRKELQQRTKKFHVDIIKLCEGFPKNAAGFETAKQIIRAAGSVGANYRASVRAKSLADFIYKIEIVLEEADESYYWLEVIKDAGLQSGLIKLKHSSKRVIGDGHVRGDFALPMMGEPLIH